MRLSMQTLRGSRHRDGDHLVAERAVDVLAAALQSGIVWGVHGVHRHLSALPAVQAVQLHVTGFEA